MINYNLTTKPLNEIVPEYNSRFFLIRNYFWDRIKYSIKLAEIKDNHKILDLGCGIGYLLEQISSQYRCQCFGIDININIVNLRIPNCKIIIADARKIPFKDSFFDVVFALDILEHIKDIDVVLQEVKRVLKDKGTFIVTGPTETLFYKFIRFLTKGTFSEKTGPGGGIHYYTIRDIDKRIILHSFIKKKSIYLPKFLPSIFAGVVVVRYTNKKTEE